MKSCCLTWTCDKFSVSFECLKYWDWWLCKKWISRFVFLSRTIFICQAILLSVILKTTITEVRLKFARQFSNIIYLGNFYLEIVFSGRILLFEYGKIYLFLHRTRGPWRLSTLNYYSWLFICSNKQRGKHICRQPLF